jgi:propanol-preferring alcohol dehydrogenase
MPIFDTVLKRITVRGSIVGTRQDLEESLAMAANGFVTAEYTWDKLENINDIFARMDRGEIAGRVVLDLQ